MCNTRFFCRSLLFCLIIWIFFGTQIFFNSKKIANAAPISPPTAAYPVRLIIPSLGINAKIRSVGITSKGLMDVPKNLSEVGWYKYGPIPGGSGNAVIDGHLNNGSSIDGVFRHLANLARGD